MKAIETVYETLLKLEKKSPKGVSAGDISLETAIDRANVSRYLNKLYEEKRIEKLDGRPVLYHSIKNGQIHEIVNDAESSFDKMAGIQVSLHTPIQQAKAAILYPPKGLHTLLLGETGAGKSMFAELMYQFAKDSEVIEKDAPFIRFNCADYAENSQLLVSQIFGVKRGAYTGADKDREGLLKKADRGFLFLDEVHRLSAQGQEMLFTFIDKGIFRPLGETDKVLSSEVRIVAATTEQPQSYLLNTFTRRIPMVIQLPSLREKDLTERYYLIEYFIKQESRRLEKSVYADKNAIIAFLLYDCPNNIGQLKSDIQLACAKAFLNYKSNKEDYILITPTDLPQHVRKGMLQINQYREGLSFLLKSKSPTLRFNYKDDADYDEYHYSYPNEDFYDAIERKLTSLKDKGLKDEEINYAINLDIESHFKRYLGGIPKETNRKDITRQIGQEILRITGEVLNLAKNKLQRSFNERIHIGLALHMQGFVERVRKGIRIYHPKLSSIRAEHPDEFMAAMEAVKLIDSALGIHTPLDEIGYLTMFLLENPLEADVEDNSKVGVLVIMHGSAVASSMAEVCNSLVGTDHAQGLDMPLHTSAEAMYTTAKEKVIELNRGRGVLLLVDMGSLVSFGQMLQEETGILVRTIEAASTPVVIDACRKAVLGRDIHYIYESIKGIDLGVEDSDFKEGGDKKDIIITACFTGEGASERLKKLIELELDDPSIAVMPMNIMNKKDFLTRLEQCKEKYNILLIASTVDFEINGIATVPAIDILSKACDVKTLATVERGYIKISRSLSRHIDADCEVLVSRLRHIIKAIEAETNITLNNEVRIGILLHMGFLIDRLKKGQTEITFPNYDSYRLQHGEMLNMVGRHLKVLEKQYGISIGEHEAAYVCRVLVSNSEEESGNAV